MRIKCGLLMETIDHNPRLTLRQQLQYIMSAIIAVLATNPINLCQSSGPDNCLVTDTITHDIMKITPVTFNSNRPTSGPVCQQKIDPEASCVCMDFVLSFKSHLITREFVKLVEHKVLDWAITLLPGYRFPRPIEPVFDKLRRVN